MEAQFKGLHEKEQNFSKHDYELWLMIPDSKTMTAQLF